MGSYLGVMKIAAGKAGCSLEEYEINVLRGLKWCTRCRVWHERDQFGIDKTRTDGKAAQCLVGRKSLFKDTYVPIPRVSKLGKRFVPARDGDKCQARARVNQMVRGGLLPDPNNVPCSKCRHIGSSRRHEYHQNQAMADKRIPLLLQIPAKVRFLSIEPMLEVIRLKPSHLFRPEHLDCGERGTSPAIIKTGAKPLIDWVIVGGESGSKKRPFNCDWARSIRAQCEEYSIPFFLKQVDKMQPIPADLMIRQFPTVRQFPTA